jgi:hypothetical protein
MFIEVRMMMKAQKVLFIYICFIILLSFTGLFATEPFWSTMPSTQTIERHDSLTGFDITKYDLSMNINDQTHFISGSVIAYVTAESHVGAIEYNLMGGTLTVTEVKVNDVINEFSFTNGIIHIPLDISAGQNFTTKVSYSGTPGNSPAPYNIGMLFTASAIYTLSNPDAGRYWWPSYDHPWDKALIDLHITVRNDWLVAGNGLRESIIDNGNGTKTHNWICSHPVATYVIGIAAGPYVEFNQTAGDLPIQNFVLPSQLNNATADFSNVPEMINYFSTVYGAYPFEKYGHALVNMSTYAAMEHQTMTTFGSQYITGTQTYEPTVAHELAHQWMGNSVTPLTMQDVWLKESFATYSEFLWTVHKSGWQTGLQYLSSSIQNYYLTWENSNGPHTIYNPVYNELFAPPTYEKSASVLHMLRLKLGNEVFSNFIHTLYNTYQDSNVITAEIKATAEQVSGQNLDQFFNQWIYNSGIPSASITVFTDGISQAKIIAQSTSNTTTQFDLEIPLHLANSAALDSVVVRATASGYANMLTYNPATDNLSGIQIDPDHWVLNRGYTSHTVSLLTCLPANHLVNVYWEGFTGPFELAGYHVWRRALPNGTFQMLNDIPYLQTSYGDTNAQNGTNYQYYVTAVDLQGFQSLPSNTLNAMPIDFPFDWGFLVVDETRDGNGVVLSPSDAQVDGFYSNVLQGMPFTAWDYITMGAPSLNTLSHYPLVLWVSDDYSDIWIDDNSNKLSSYISSGGKLVISGWKYPGAMPQTFFSAWFPAVTPTLINQPTLISAQSDTYPILHPDPAKLPASWNGMLSMPYIFDGEAEILYNADLTEGTTGDGMPLAIKAVNVDNPGTVVMLGFPLYYMMETEVRSFMLQLLPELYPTVAVTDENITPQMLKLTCYPNPFTHELRINPGKTVLRPMKISLFNIKGQKVKSWTLSNAKEIIWNGKDESGKTMSDGMYLIKVNNGKETQTNKVLKIDSDSKTTN